MDPFYLSGGSRYDASMEVPKASRLPHNMTRVDPDGEDENLQGSRYHHSAAGTRHDEEDEYLQGSRYQNNVATGQSRVHYGHYYGHDITINNTYSSQSTKDVYTECLDSLKPDARNPRLQTVETAHEESFHWIWDEGSSGPGFVSWTKTGTGFYWVSGKPGAGKSTLMKYIYKNFEAKVILPSPTERRIIQAGYFFHELGIPQEQTFFGFLAATLHQLLFRCKELSSVVLPIFKRERAAAGEQEAFAWTEESLKEALWVISRQREVEATVYLFVDGLDECESDVVRRDQLDKFLVPWVERMKDTSLSVKVCLASRKLLEIELYLARWPGLRIHERTAEDIFKYVKSGLHQTTELLAQKHKNRHFRHQVRDRLIQSIVAKAEGVFLWVKLVLKETIHGLEAGNSDPELQSHIDSLPTDIKNLYAKILQDINPQYWSGTWVYTQMLCHLIPGHFVTLLEASFAEDSLEAISQYQHESYFEEQPLLEKCDRMRDRIQSRCGVLLDIVPSILQDSPLTTPGPETREPAPANIRDGYDWNYQFLTFVHRSVKEYLEESNTKAELLGRVSKDQQLDANVALMRGSLGALIANHDWWPPWSHPQGLFDYYKEHATVMVKPSVRPTLINFFEYLGTLDQCTQYPTEPYIELLDEVYTAACKRWHDQYYHFWGGQGITWVVDMKLWGPFVDIIGLATLLGHARYLVAKLQTGNWTTSDKILLLLCAIDGTKFERYPLEILVALLKAQTPIDKAMFVPWTPWGHALLSFWQIGTCSLKKWFYILQLFLEHGADPNYRLPRVLFSYPAQLIWSSASSPLSLPVSHPNSPPIPPSLTQSPLRSSLPSSPHPFSSPSLSPSLLSLSPSPQWPFPPAEERHSNPFKRPERADSGFTTPLHIIVARFASIRMPNEYWIVAEYKRLVELLFSYGADPMLPDSNGELVNTQIEEILNFRCPEYRQTLNRLKITVKVEYSARTWGKHSMLLFDMSDYWQCPGGFITVCGLMVMAGLKTTEDATQSQQESQID